VATRRARGRWSAAAAALVLGAGWAWLATHLERFVDRVVEAPLPRVSERARALHAGSFVVDLHADSLLFGRDLLRRSDVGHVDLPRLREGGVGLQVFTTVTVFPLRANIDRTDGAGLDALTLMGWVRLSRPFALGGPFERALAQAARLEAFAHASGGGLRIVRSRADLEALRAAHQRDPRVVGALLGIEGAHALEGDPAKLERAFAAGFRLMGLTHFFDNAYAGSAHGLAKGGLTALGRDTLRRMEQLGMLVDLAHLSPAAIDEVLDLATKPVVVSHTGVKATCDNARNLSDAQLRRIAANGGVVGIGYWETAACGLEPRYVAAAIRHVVLLVGDDHVGLGSDWDGGTTVGFDASQLPVVTQALLDAGLPEASIRKILGGNALRVLAQTLPE
jgi:membrane dipeptidase